MRAAQRGRAPSAERLKKKKKIGIGCAFAAYLVNSNVVRSVRRGGHLNNGSNDGLRYVNANNAPSNGNWNYGGAQNLTQSSAHPLLRFPAPNPKKFLKSPHIPFRGSKSGNRNPSDWSGLVDLSRNAARIKRTLCHEAIWKFMEHLLLRRKRHTGYHQRNRAQARRSHRLPPSRLPGSRGARS